MNKWIAWLGIAVLVGSAWFASWTSSERNSEEAACLIRTLGSGGSCNPSTSWLPVIGVAIFGLALLIASSKMTKSLDAEGVEQVTNRNG